MAAVSKPDPQIASRLTGAVWGHLVGDAVGVPYEFRAASQIGEVRFGATGSHHQPAGTWSDDGALMLALLDSLLSVGFDPEDQGRRIVAWYRDGAYTPDGDGVFDVGITTRSAISALESGVPADGAGPTERRASGNGSLMRILPLALVFRDVPDAELIDLAHRASRVTHGTNLAQVACALYALTTRRLLGGSSSRASALEFARPTLRSVYSAGSPDHLEALDELEAWTSRGGSGYVVDSFWSAWDAFAGADSYRDTIERAVAYGEDTDTTAAIAGGLAGIRWGIDGIPSDWRAGMRGREVASPLVDRLLETDGWRTSTANPIRVDWVDLAQVPGLASASGGLGMTFLPGRQREGWTGPHWRDLEADASRLRTEHKVDDLLLLVEDHELVASRVAGMADVMKANGIDLIRHPILGCQGANRLDFPRDAFRRGAPDRRAADGSSLRAWAGSAGRGRPWDASCATAVWTATRPSP